MLNGVYSSPCNRSQAEHEEEEDADRNTPHCDFNLSDDWVRSKTFSLFTCMETNWCMHL